METKRNLKYFTSYGIHPGTIVGLALAVIGIVLVALFIKTSDMKIVAGIGAIVAIAGFVVLYIINGGKSSPDDIDYQIYDKVKYLDETAQKRHEIYESHFSKFIKPVTIKGFDYTEREDLCFKKGSDNKNRTNVYNTAIIYFTKDKLYTYGYHFSLTNAEFDEEIMGKYKFLDLDHAEIIEGEAVFPRGKYVSRVKTYTFRIVKNDGTVVLNMMVDYGADIDKAVADINRILTVAKDEAAAKAAAQQ